MSGLKLGDGLTLPLELATEPLGILANRGRGKSYAAHVLVEEIHDAGVPVVVLDVKGDWWGVRSSADGRSEGLPFYIFGGDHADLPLEPTAGELLADLVVDERVPVVLDLSHLSKTKARSFATVFAERLYHRNREPLFVVVDEADVLVPQRATAETARLLGAFEDLAKRGRGRGIGMAVVTQRPQEVAKSVLDLMETLVLLGMTGPRALKAVEEWTSIHVDDDHGVRRELPTMQVGEAYVWSPLHGVLKRIRVRPLRTFDSHPTPKPGETRRTPRKWTPLDLEQLGAKIAETVERAKDNDPRLLRVQLAEQRQRVDELEQQVDQQATEWRAEVETLTADLELERETNGTLGAEHIERLAPLVQELTDVAAALAASLHAAARVGTSPPLPPPPPAPAPRPAPSVVPKPAPRATTPAPDSDDQRPLRKGARRMVEALGQMHPLRLSKSQWGTVAKLKTTGGTWSTYLSEIRARGYIDENAAGYTLTPAGFDYIGGQPAPMTAAELQQHYLSILREGARRMLETLMAAHPDTLDKATIGERAGLSISGGTWSTYMSELTRNGLVEKVGGEYRATDLLMYGADLAQ